MNLITLEKLRPLLYPEKLSYLGTLGFTMVLFLVQQMEGTNPVFSLGCFMFIMLAVAAFNVAGGLYFCSGAFIFFNSTLCLIIGLLVKAFFGEPADLNLQNPLLTIAVYVAGMAAMLLAAFATKHFRKERALVAGIVGDHNLYGAYVGCMVIGLGSVAFYTFFTVRVAPGSFLAIFNQINHFLPVGLVLGVLWTIKSSGGRKSMTPILGFVATGLTGLVLLSYSKQTLFTPIVCWLIPASFMRFRLRWFHVLFLVSFLYVTYNYAIPYAQYGRALTMEGTTEIGKVGYLLTHFQEVKDGYQTQQQEEVPIHYFNSAHGIFDRLNMVAIDDSLIDYGDRHGSFGLAPIWFEFENLVPHFLWLGKPNANYGNLWAHEIGIVSPDDIGTGISFSASAEAFREEGWIGVLLVEPLVFIFIFFVMDSVLGDVRQNPVALFMIVLLAHTAPELGLAPQIWVVTYLMFGVIVVCLSCGTLLPIIGRVFAGSQNPSLQRIAPLFIPQSARVPATAEVAST